jgi:hypothetical protein
MGAHNQKIKMKRKIKIQSTNQPTVTSFITLETHGLEEGSPKPMDIERAKT